MLTKEERAWAREIYQENTRRAAELSKQLKEVHDELIQIKSQCSIRYMANKFDVNQRYMSALLRDHRVPLVPLDIRVLNRHRGGS